MGLRYSFENYEIKMYTAMKYDEYYRIQENGNVFRKGKSI